MRSYKKIGVAMLLFGITCGSAALAMEDPPAPQPEAGVHRRPSKADFAQRQAELIEEAKRRKAQKPQSAPCALL